MTNLVQKQITDKNGVNSVRWVKPDQGASAALANLPVPIVTKVNPDRQKMIRKAAELYVANIATEGDGDIDDFIETTVEDFSQYSDAMIFDINHPCNEEYGYFRIFGLKRMIENGEDETTLRDWLHISDVFEEYDYADSDEAVAVSAGFGNYPMLVRCDSNEKYPEERRLQLKALLGLTIWTETMVADGKAPEDSIVHVPVGYAYTAPIMTDNRIVSRIAKNPSSASAVIRFLEERRNADVDAIIEVLDSPTQALSEGAL